MCFEGWFKNVHSKGIEGLAGEKEDFLSDVGLDRRPVMVEESGVMFCQGLWAGEDCWQRSFRHTVAVQGFAGNLKQDSAAIVQVGGGEQMSFLAAGSKSDSRSL